jgi:hypothetical protein
MNPRPGIKLTCESSEYDGGRLHYYRRRTSKTKRGTTMNSVTSSWRKRRAAARTHRAIQAALARSSSPAMRDELLTMSATDSFYSARR